MKKQTILHYFKGNVYSAVSQIPEFLFEEIQEIRGLLYERYNNKPKIYDEARVFHYKVFGKILKEKIEAFANKYNLHINID